MVFIRTCGVLIMEASWEFWAGWWNYLSCILRITVTILLKIPYPPYICFPWLLRQHCSWISSNFTVAPSQTFTGFSTLQSLNTGFPPRSDLGPFLFSVYISLFNFSSLRALNIRLDANDSDFFISRLYFFPELSYLLPTPHVLLDEEKTQHAPNWIP